ncbi:MAG TPA: heme-binding protein [Thermoanaerobaculia bacterium]|nr:heme-binding protein [Thermoanaerobaculia bacterium]
MNSGSESDRARSPRLRRVLWALLALVVTAAAISWLSPPPALGIPPPREPHEPVDPTNPPDPHDPSDPSDPTGHEPPPIFAPAAVCPDGALPLAASEARDLALRAATAIDPSPMTVAVVDRAGNVLALLRRPSGSTALDDRAIGLARTGAFFSSDQAPLSSRTVRFISGLHFPPGIRRTPNAALYGIENTNRGCDLNVAFLPGKAVPPARRFAGGACQSGSSGSTAGCGTGPVTGKPFRLDRLPEDRDASAVDPGGLPIFRAGHVVGGLGVALAAPSPAAEYAAFSALAPPFAPPAGEILLDGIRLPFAAQRTIPPGVSSGGAIGAFAAPPGDGACAPDEQLAGPLAGSLLSAAEVSRIVGQAVAAANRTRAAIRLPAGSRTRMTIAVADLDGRILALYRMRDGTVFSIDVAVAKARNVVYLSGPSAEARLDMPGVAGLAVSNRTVDFTTQHLYPPGIDGSGPGPFLALFQNDLAHPCSQGSQPPNPNQNGIVFFAGSVPLYKGSTLAGGLGVSGDGVEQDDYVSFRGAEGFLPPPALWADRVKIGGARLPFLKFPRNPER